MEDSSETDHHNVYLLFNLETMNGIIKSRPEITLRPFKLSDVDDFMEWTEDEAVTKFCRWDSFPSRDAALEFLSDVIERHPWYRAVCVDGAPVGSIYVMPGPAAGKDERRGEIGYALKSVWWGRGVATRAVEIAMSRVFEELTWLERVEGLVFLENKASQRVLEKAGFFREGVLRSYFFVKGKSWDIVVYSVVKGDKRR